jgi:hypothetical protein
MFVLEVDPLDLGADVKAIGLELLEPRSQEPVRGPQAARIWARVLPSLSFAEPLVLDFFSHLDRVREYCRTQEIPFRNSGSRCIVVPAPEPGPLEQLLQRFEAETFGARSGGAVAGDAELEGELSRRGADGYHHAYPRYQFCAVCDFENGSLTLLSVRLWGSEVVRRISPVVKDLAVEVRLPI